MGGVAVISADSPLQTGILKRMRDLHEPEMIHFDDLITLSRNMRDYESRMRRINKNASQLIEWLQGEECRPFIESLHFPGLDESENYHAILREGGGYGGLFSIVLKGGSEVAATFYDNLQVLKGPSLGCNFTLACPYTLLAHFGELEWVEKQGISRNLIRVSVGLEDIEELQEAFRTAFSALTTSSLPLSQQ